MTFGRFCFGWLLLGATISGAGVGGWAIRRRVVPEWNGPPARLAEVVGASSIVIMTSQVLGSVGQFKPVQLALAVLVIGAGLLIALGRPPAPARPPAVAEPRWMASLAIASIAVISGQWGARILEQVRSGIGTYDNLWYHLPVAARFAKTGWLTRTHLLTPDFPVSWHQSNSEVAHAIGMLYFERDVLSLFVSIPYLAVALLAAFCIGHPVGRGWLCVLASTVVFGSTIVGLGHAGGAYSDLPAAAFGLAAVALLLQPAEASGEAGKLGLAGAAAGIALGSKLTIAGLIVALSVVAVLTARRAMTTRRATVTWCLPLLATGSFWFLRNLWRAGSPVPGTKVGIGPLAFPSGSYPTVERLGYSVSDYLVDGSVWRDWFAPGLRIALGPGWPLTIGLACAATAVALFRHTPWWSLERGLGLILMVGFVSYLVAPTTALGEHGAPTLFTSNLRYTIPVLALALALLPVLVTRHPAIIASLCAIAVAISQFSRGAGRYPAWPAGYRAAGIGVALVVLAVGIALVRIGPLQLPTSLARALAVGAVSLAVSVTWGVTGWNYEDRYRPDPIDAWAQTQSDQRIAVEGSQVAYPLYGRDLSNTVEWLGTEGPHAELMRAQSCTEIRRLLRSGGYDFAVVGTATNPAGDWIARDPAAEVLLPTPERTLYRLDTDKRDPGCASKDG